MYLVSLSASHDLDSPNVVGIPGAVLAVARHLVLLLGDRSGLLVGVDVATADNMLQPVNRRTYVSRWDTRVYKNGPLCTLSELC